MQQPNLNLPQPPKVPPGQACTQDYLLGCVANLLTVDCFLTMLQESCTLCDEGFLKGTAGSSPCLSTCKLLSDASTGALCLSRQSAKNPERGPSNVIRLSISFHSVCWCASRSYEGSHWCSWFLHQLARAMSACCAQPHSVQNEVWHKGGVSVMPWTLHAFSCRQ